MLCGFPSFDCTVPDLLPRVTGIGRERIVCMSGRAPRASSGLNPKSSDWRRRHYELTTHMPKKNERADRPHLLLVIAKQKVPARPRGASSGWTIFATGRGAGA